jgi:hypothetical protein
MTSATNRTRILNPLERFTEIVFGLIMVLSFTGALATFTLLQTTLQVVAGDGWRDKAVGHGDRCDGPPQGPADYPRLTLTYRLPLSGSSSRLLQPPHGGKYARRSLIASCVVQIGSECAG